MAELRQWDGTQWVTITDEAHRADAGDPHPQYVLKTDNTVDNLLDADTSTVAPVPGDGLVWDGTNWVPGAPVGQGIIPLAAVVAATTGPIDLAAPPAVIDGVTLVAADRILVKDQADGTENGVYIYGTPLARAADVSAEGDLQPGNSVLVSGGDTHGTVTFLVALASAELPWTPDVDLDYWFSTFSALDIVPGAGLTLTGKTLDVGQGQGILVGADDVALDLTFTDGRYATAAHAHALDDLTDVDTTTVAPVAGDQLAFDGAGWVPQAPVAGGVDELSELLDVDLVTVPPVDRDSLIYDLASTKWIPGTVSSGGVTDHGALTGLTDNDHPQYPLWAISATEPATPAAGQFWTVIP